MKRTGMAVMLACVASSVSADDTARRRPSPPPSKPPPAKVTVEGQRALTASSLTAAAVVAKIRGPYLAAVRRCYGEQLARSSSAKGKLVLGFQVTARGETAAVRATSFDARVDACVSGQAAAWKFPVPTSPEGAPAAASFEVSFRLEPDPVASLEEEAARYADLLVGDSGSSSEGDMSARRPRPGADLDAQIREVREGGKQPAVAIGGGVGARGGGGTRVGVGSGGGGDVRVGGGTGPKVDASPSGRVAIASKRALGTSSLGAEAVVAKIASAYMAGIKRCYHQRLKQDPAVRGKLAVSLEVSETGRAQRPKVRGFEASVDTCVEQQMSTWRFPVPKDAAGEPTMAAFELELELSPG